MEPTVDNRIQFVDVIRERIRIAHRATVPKADPSKLPVLVMLPGREIDDMAAEEAESILDYFLEHTDELLTLKGVAKNG